MSIDTTFFFDNLRFRTWKKTSFSLANEGRNFHLKGKPTGWWLSDKESACQCRRHGFDPTWVWSMIWEDTTCLGATKPLHRNHWASALEPRNHNCWAYVLQRPKPKQPRACVLQQEKPPEWEAHASQLESSTCLLQLEKSLQSNEDPAQLKVNKH